jgi:hypothetical protein
LPDHLFVNWFSDSKEAADVSVDYFIPGTVGRSSKVIATIDGRIVYQNVDTAPLLNNLARQFFQTKPIGDGNFEAQRSALKGFDFRNDFRGQIVAAVVIKGDVGAFACEDFAERSANSARSSGYECALPFQQ